MKKVFAISNITAHEFLSQQTWVSPGTLVTDGKKFYVLLTPIMNFCDIDKFNVLTKQQNKQVIPILQSLSNKPVLVYGLDHRSTKQTINRSETELWLPNSEERNDKSLEGFTLTSQGESSTVGVYARLQKPLKLREGAVEVGTGWNDIGIVLSQKPDSVYFTKISNGNTYTLSKKKHTIIILKVMKLLKFLKNCF